MHIKRFVFIVAVLFFFSCEGQSDTYQSQITPRVITPSNLQLAINIVGVDAEHPNGDGTGKIECIASANDAVKYTFNIANYEEVTNSQGIGNYTFIDKGTNNFIIQVSAFSEDNKLISTSKGIQVFVNDEMNLVWTDEFDSSGAPDVEKWGYDIGGNGWGNQEKQYYTDRSDNVKIEDGLLKIIAKKENYSNSEYTSARLLTKDKFEFTYGKVEVKAKLPLGGGTWPAIWMLGSNINDASVGWPACGEIDIMEHVGNNQGVASSALHTLSSYGNTQNKKEKFVENISSEFHVYSVDWMPKKIVFAIDGVNYYTYAPNNKSNENWPYTKDQFLILNVALGGSFGGAIDAAFTQSSMEIDYVRVYQKHQESSTND